MKTSRRLAAIMFTDIQGYTRLMQQSESEGIDIRRRHRGIFEPATRRHDGEIIQYYGDGTLSIFSSSVQAVRGACEMQQQFQEEPIVPVRIGIHTGDIVLSNEEIIGDCVNLAARIESLGVAGSVMISGKVEEEIRNQDDLYVKSMGTFHFKNDSRKREVFALEMPGLIIPQKKDLAGKLEKKSS